MSMYSEHLKDLWERLRDGGDMSEIIAELPDGMRASLEDMLYDKTAGTTGYQLFVRSALERLLKPRFDE